MAGNRSDSGMFQIEGQPKIVVSPLVPLNYEKGARKAHMPIWRQAHL